MDTVHFLAISLVSIHLYSFFSVTYYYFWTPLSWKYSIQQVLEGFAGKIHSKKDSESQKGLKLLLYFFGFFIIIYIQYVKGKKWPFSHMLVFLKVFAFKKIKKFYCIVAILLCFVYVSV